MLVKWEQYAYNIAYSAATGVPFNKDHEICPACNGTGLLPHPTSYMRVALCYLCHNGLVGKHDNVKVTKFKAQKESCNVSSTSISA